MRHASTGLIVSVSAISLIGVIAVPLFAQQGGREQGRWTAQKAAKSFNHMCAKCHTVPDTKFKTDLAWLDQVNRTS